MRGFVEVGQRIKDPSRMPVATPNFQELRIKASKFEKVSFEIVQTAETHTSISFPRTCGRVYPHLSPLPVLASYHNTNLRNPQASTRFIGLLFPARRYMLKKSGEWPTYLQAQTDRAVLAWEVALSTFNKIFRQRILYLF